MFMVISDGEDQSGGVAAAVAAVKAEHIRVHCIGIGSPVESLIPVGFEGGRDVFLRARWSDKSCLEGLLNQSSIHSCQGVLDRQRTVGPPVQLIE